jgi:hypothetical protein
LTPTVLFMEGPRITVRERSLTIVLMIQAEAMELGRVVAIPDDLAEGAQALERFRDKAGETQRYLLADARGRLTKRSPRG